MCTGGRLIADFVAGTDARPSLPAQLDKHLTITTNGQWVVWAHKLARPAGDLFVPLTGGPGYPPDATARCLPRGGRGVRGVHDAPDPACTCGFHALSSQFARDKIIRDMRSARRVLADFAALTVALSGRVLAFEWAGPHVLWRAERQTVIGVDRPTPPDRTANDIKVRVRATGVSITRWHPGDPDGRPAIASPVSPRDSGPVRLDLPIFAPVLPVCHDDAGFCVVRGMLEPRSAVLVPA
jgi:hypothetical protein